MYSTIWVSKDKKFFTNPSKFDPDRWTRDEIHPFAVAPFGFGSRGCWGNFMHAQQYH